MRIKTSDREEAIYSWLFGHKRPNISRKLSIVFSSHLLLWSFISQMSSFDFNSMLFFVKRKINGEKRTNSETCGRPSYIGFGAPHSQKTQRKEEKNCRKQLNKNRTIRAPFAAINKRRNLFAFQHSLNLIELFSASSFSLSYVCITYEMNISFTYH